MVLTLWRNGSSELKRIMYWIQDFEQGMLDACLKDMGIFASWVVICPLSVTSQKNRYTAAVKKYSS